MSYELIRNRWDDLVDGRGSVDRPSHSKIAILATFVAEPIAPFLGVRLDEEGIVADIHFGPYNQCVQECLDPQSGTAEYAPQILVVWPRFEELWGGLPAPLDADAAPYLARATPFVDAAMSAANKLGATLIVALPALPESRPLGVGDASNLRGVVATAIAAREDLRHRLAGQPGVVLFDVEESVRAVGAIHAYNPRLAALAQMPFSDALLDHAGRALARIVRMLHRAPRKLIVVDGDNTLWGGIVGEDGPERIDLRENGPGVAFLEFQSYLLELRSAGVLLALVSKNRESDVWDVFARREMRLQREHLAAWRVGWQDKSSAICEIAEELQLAVDSVVFIDDNPAEIAEVGSRLPTVACVLMPSDPVEWRASVQSGVLDRPPPTGDDLQRAAFYTEEQQRKQVQRTALSPAEFRAQLGVAVRVFEPTANDLPRLAQLVNKTNQFNLNGVRRSEAAITALLTDGHHTVRLVSARDHYGDYGIVGAFIVDLDGKALDTFLLSCRAMGRGIEEAMIAALDELVGQLRVTVIELPRNEPARAFFAKLGCVVGVASELAPTPWPEYIQRT